jgi:Rad/Gem-related GTP binding protein 1
MSTYIPDAMVVVYSVVNMESMKVAEETLHYLFESGSCTNKAVILVGNKTDLVRTRVVNIDGMQTISPSSLDT